MRQATTQGLYQYWNTVRRGRIAPRRYEIEPSQIVPFLSETIILEQPSVSACRVRVAGTQVCDWFGDDLRGALFLEQWEEDDRLVMQDNLHTIAQHGGVGVFLFEGELVEDAPVAQFELLLLPLTHVGDRIERVLGSVALIKAPAWLETSGPNRLRLTSNQIVWPDGRPRGLLEREQDLPLRHYDMPSLKGQAGIRRARLVRSDRRSFLVYDGGLSGTSATDKSR